MKTARLPQGVTDRSVWANGDIVRYRLTNGWFIDRATGPHKHPCFRYQIFEPGASAHGFAEPRGGGMKLAEVVKKALHSLPSGPNL